MKEHDMCEVDRIDWRSDLFIIFTKKYDAKKYPYSLQKEIKMFRIV